MYNPISNLRRLSLVALSCFVLSWTDTHAQFPEKELENASTSRFMDGDVHFILVEAFKDGFIKEAVSYDFDYCEGDITINGRALPQPALDMYRKKLIAFYRPVLIDKGYSFFLRGDGFTLSELLDTSSSFHHPTGLHSKRAYHKPDDEYILHSLVKDGIADSAETIHLVYTRSGLTINGHKLTHRMEQKYMSLIMSMCGFIPKRETDIHRIDGSVVMH